MVLLESVSHSHLIKGINQPYKLESNRIELTTPSRNIVGAR